jgi:hypothetical protein
MYRTGPSDIKIINRDIKVFNSLKVWRLVYVLPGLMVKCAFCPHFVFVCCICLLQKNSDHFLIRH